MTLKELEKVLYFESYVVIDPGETPLQCKRAAERERVPQGASRSTA